jgi:hypothetical protein
LVTALLSCLIPDRPGREVSKQNGTLPGNNSNAMSALNDLNLDHVHVASQILYHVLERWATPVNLLRGQTHRALQESLKDMKNIANGGAASHYGAIHAMTTLGAPVLETMFLPQLNAYTCNILSEMTKADEAKKNAFNFLLGAAANAARTMIQHRNRTDDWANHISYSILYELFGDSLCVSPLPNFYQLPSPPSKEIIGRLRIKRLGERLSPKKTPQKAQQFLTSKSFSNNLPEDIFEPAASASEEEKERYEKLLQTRPDLTPKKISPLVRSHFETSKEWTVARYKPMALAVGRPVTKDRLKRKTLQIPVAHFDQAKHKSLKACIGKRMSYPKTTERYKKMRLFSCTLTTTL